MIQKSSLPPWFFRLCWVTDMSAKNRRKPVSIDVKRLVSYAIAGTAAVNCSAKLAEAGITYTQVNALVNDTTGGGTSRNLTFTPTGGGAVWNFELGHFFTPATGGVPAEGLAFGGAISLNLANAAQFAGVAVVNGAVTNNYFANLATNAVINIQPFIGGGSAVGTLANGPGPGQDQFRGQGPGFIGVKFNTDQFGWIRVNMNGAPINSFTIVDYAYAGRGESIFAGQIAAVPEPSSLCLLALGSVGIMAWRRRRAAALSSAA